MKKLKSVIVGSLLVATIIFTPAMSFAKNSEQNDNMRERNSSSNSLMNRIMNFFEDDDGDLAPIISGITAPTVLRVGEVGTWKIKASDPQDGTLDYNVNWGDENNAPILERDMGLILVQTTTFTHSYSHAGRYTITFTVSNEAGLETSSQVTVRVIGSQVNTQPVISGLTVTSIKSNKATINWKTNVRANSIIWYGTTPLVSNGETPDIIRNAKILKHKIVLTGLEANTKYYVVVGSENNAGRTISTEISFTTKGLVTDLSPVITGLEGSGTINVGQTETVIVHAYDPKNGTLSYSVDWGDTDTTSTTLTKQEPIFVQTTSFSHVYSLPGTYTAKFTVENSAGLKDVETMKIVVNPISVGISPNLNKISE
ncbi:MAG: PKD domain-containing protein [Candidatus Paceibacterota bacterium]|jgi:PKD repeat protein